MPFLFVDYDQGAGGEYLSYILSKAPQCNPVDGFKTNTGRYKINDIFEQEFLKPAPNPIIAQSHPTLYDVVPCHRHGILAESLLTNIKTIRIQNPTDKKLCDYFLQQRLSKVLLACEPTYEMFVGQVRILEQTATNPNFLSMINHKMDVLTLRLIANNIEPTEQNKEDYINSMATKSDEPSYSYDLVIPYEKLITDPQWVKDNISTTFNIEVDLDLLSTYKHNYENAQYS